MNETVFATAPSVKPHRRRRETPEQRRARTEPMRRAMSGQVAAARARRPVVAPAPTKFEWAESGPLDIKWNAAGQVVIGRLVKIFVSARDRFGEPIIEGVVTRPRQAPPPDYTPPPKWSAAAALDEADGWPHRPLHIHFPVPASLGRFLAKVQVGEEVVITFLGRSDEPNSEPRFRVEVAQPADAA